jgi:predicted transglutaminase-like cysteine proteinase
LRRGHGEKLANASAVKRVGLELVMKRWFGAAVFLVATFVSSTAMTANSPSYAPEFGRSLPPVGFVKFCVANPGECKGVGRRVARVDATPAAWANLSRINARVNAEIAPVSDEELYGVPEFWTYPVNAGDCEDYLLLKKRELQKLGFDSGALLITVVLDEKNEGHAVLTVATDRGDYVLDNRRNDILLWKDTGYTFLKRQSQQDPRAWVALTDAKLPVLKSTAGN